MLIKAQAPSNIALIKYMGKIEGTGNRPTNTSISYSLPHLVTEVCLSPSSSGVDEWAPLQNQGFVAPTLSEKGKSKFLNHFARLKDQWGVVGAFRIESANNFPSDCGLASSASSFAALTKATALLRYEMTGEETSVHELSMESRKGSGSSCRSFFEPWSLWENEGAEAVDLGYPNLLHAAVVISAGVKEVSSSQAHVRVTSSPQFEGRTERAHQRLRSLMGALQEGDWRRSFEICRDEFIDMHELFETSIPSFSYRTNESKDVTDACQHIWNFKGDGPIVTMDAGPNVHLLFRENQRDLADKMIDHFKKKHMVISSWRGFR